MAVTTLVTNYSSSCLCILALNLKIVLVETIVRHSSLTSFILTE